MKEKSLKNIGVSVLSILSLFLFFLLLLSFFVISFDSSVQLGLFLSLILVLLIRFALYGTAFEVFDKKEAWLERWAWMKKTFNMIIDDSFNLVDEEKIIFPLTPCYIKAGTVMSKSQFVRDVIVTNKRILIGFHINIFFIQKETFGQMNLWNKHFKMNNNSSNQELMSKRFLGDLEITEIRLERETDQQNKEHYLKLKVKSPTMLSATYEMHHPKSKEIYELFLK